jgi:hypothetical protein
MKFSDIKLTDIGNSIQMVGAVYEDAEGKGLYFPFPSRSSGGAPAQYTAGYVEMTTEDWKLMLRQADLVETEVLVKSKDGELYKALVRKSQRQIDTQVSWNVFRRDNFACRYCGAEHLSLTVDHLIRWENGGASVEANLVASCRPCNKVRGDTAYAAWLRHPYYLEKAGGLSIAVRARNEAVAGELADIPRAYIKKDR